MHVNLNCACLTASLLLCAASCGQPFEPAWGDEAPPSILVISIDTLRADHLGTYGHDRPTSPNLDRLAASSTVFENAQASASWTLPGLASILTSTFTSTHNCWSFASRLDPSFTTLAEVLRDAGYDTACVTSHVFLSTRYGLQQGFVHFDDAFAHPDEDPKDTITSEMVSDRGIRFLRQKAAAPDGTPWLLWLHYFDPHGVYLPHDGISEQFGTTDELDLYDGEIAFTDLHVGRVLDALEQQGLAGNTIVVFVADHGEEFGDHGGWRHGHTLYEELVRVPMFLRAPGIAPSRIEDTVRTVDIFPTLLDLVSLPVPTGPPGPDGQPGPGRLEGVSLAPAMGGEPLGRLPALAEIRLDDAAHLDSLVLGRWKVIEDAESGRRWLFDLEGDPKETHDLADERPEVVLEMARMLKGMRLQAKERSLAYHRAEELDLAPSELEHLRGLGYLGDDQ